MKRIKIKIKNRKKFKKKVSIIRKANAKRIVW